MASYDHINQGGPSINIRRIRPLDKETHQMQKGTACWGGGSDKKFCNQILKAVSNAYDPLEWQGLFKKIPAWYYPLHKISKNYFM